MYSAFFLLIFPINLNELISQIILTQYVENPRKDNVERVEWTRQKCQHFSTK